MKRTVATAEQLEGLTLMRMRTVNVHGVRLIDISLADTLTTVGGDNGQGKTSFFKSYAYGLGGKAVFEPDALRHGEREGSIMLDFGDGQKVRLRVTREIRRVGDEDLTAEVHVEIPGYITPSRVQDFLDKLAGEIGVDPMAFDAMKDSEQVEVLRGLVGDFDFEANAAEHAEIFKERTDVGRDQKREQAAADGITVSDTAPGERTDEADLIARLRKAGEDNVALTRSHQQRADESARAQRLRSAAADHLATIEVDVAAETGRCTEHCIELRDQIADYEQQIKALHEKIERTRERIVAREAARDAEHARIRAVRTQAAEEENKAAAVIENWIASLPALAERTNTDELEKQLNEARTKNRAVEDWEAQRARKQGHQRAADAHQKDYEQKTAELAELEHARADAIAKAHLPVDGLGFGDGHITLNGAHWKAASEAQRVDASTAIAMALNPKLHVILIRNGSGVGSKIREQIRRRAAEQGYRVLLEVLDESGENSNVYIEDGLVKRIDGKEAPAPADPQPLDMFAGGTMAAGTSDSGTVRQTRARRPWQGPGAPKDAQP